MHIPTPSVPCVCCTGGKKGVDMAGMSDLGGVKFFNLAVETPEGDIEVLELVMQGEWGRHREMWVYVGATAVLTTCY
jgi:hypothetical protein